MRDTPVGGAEEPPYDPGVQPERTKLAWRRTALAIGCGALLSMRVVPGMLGPAGVLLACAALLFSAVLWGAAQKRYLMQRTAIGRDSARRPGSELLLALTAFSTVVGVVLLIVMLRARA